MATTIVAPSPSPPSERMEVKMATIVAPSPSPSSARMEGKKMGHQASSKTCLGDQIPAPVWNLMRMLHKAQPL